MATQASKEWVAHAWAERTQSLPLPWGAWSRGPEEETFRFPAHWVVERLDMAGWPSDVSPDLASLSRAAKSLAVSGKRVSIAIDDPTRPSPLGPILKALVLGLREAGISDSDIDLVMALGAHGRPASREVRMKVGEWIADRFTVRFHDPHGELSDTGLRLGNTPVRIDRHFFAADLRIGVSTVIPNPFAGFSGGGKIVLPGLASIEALHWLHKLA